MIPVVGLVHPGLKQRPCLESTLEQLNKRNSLEYRIEYRQARHWNSHMVNN
mgnify:FL=1